MAELSVIVVNWNGGEGLEECLRSVYAAAAEVGTSVEVWLVDNASSDGSAERATQAFPELGVVKNEQNLGFARAANQGLARALGRLALLLNPDAEISAEALGRLLGLMREDPKVGIAGCGSVDDRGGAAPGCELSFPGERGVPVEQGPGPGRDVAWVSGACLLARREMMEEVGLLDEGFFMYYEDADWCRRAREAGWRVVTAPEVKVRHRLGGSSAQVSEAERAGWAARSRLRFYRKHYRPARVWWLRVRMSVTAALGRLGRR
jgi:hypothetical protein